MSADTVLILARQALETTLRVCGPALIAALVVGVLISIFQVATSIQDPNLPCARPKVGSRAPQNNGNS